MTADHAPRPIAPEESAPLDPGTTTPPGTPHRRAQRFVRGLAYGAFAGLVVGGTVGTGFAPLVLTVTGGLVGALVGLALGLVEAVALLLLPCTPTARPAVRVVGALAATVSGGILAHLFLRDPDLALLQPVAVAFTVVCAGAGLAVADVSAYRLTAAATDRWRLTGTSALVGAGVMSLGRAVSIGAQETTLLVLWGPVLADLVAGVAWAVVGTVRARHAVVPAR